MVRFYVSVPDDLNREFRRLVAEFYGYKKGNLQVAVEEAFRLWIREKRDSESGA